MRKNKYEIQPNVSNFTDSRGFPTLYDLPSGSFAQSDALPTVRMVG
jgi:hypothetical protein